MTIGPIGVAAGETVRSRLAGFHRARWHGSRGGADLVSSGRPGPGAILVNGNDHLAIGTHPSIVDAHVRALREAGNSVLMSAVFLTGQANPYLRLERRFAELLGARRAILCQSGWAANVGLLAAIAGPDDRVYLDATAHRSLDEGARAGARIAGFRHNSVEDLRRRLRAHGPGIVLVDSVYSSDGSVCPLAELVATAVGHGCLVVVDESHSFGAQGFQGRGMVAEPGLAGSVAFRTASLSKAFAGRAGLVT